MKQKKLLLICLLFSFCFVLSACGTTSSTKTDKEILEEMKEVALSDESASLYLPKDWTSEETGSVNLIMVTKGNELGAMMFQFPKNSGYQIYSVEDTKELIQKSYQISEGEEIEAFEISGMSNVSVVQSKMAVEGLNSEGETIADSVSGEACFAYGETDYAFYAIGYMSFTKDTKKEDMLPYLKVSCSQFKEYEEAIEQNTVGTIELTDTVRWFNASYAVLTELNGHDYTIFAGLPMNETSKGIAVLSLRSSWEITDRTTADETILWLLEEGHGIGFREYIYYLQDYGYEQAENKEEFLLEHFEITKEQVPMYESWYEMYKQYGEEAIDGWDYCRALNVLSYCYLAGYYTEEEALDMSLEIAQLIQPLFDSWDDLIGSWLRGYEYWAEESSAERQAIYEEIKTRSDNPYQIDFKMKLEKTW